MTGATPAPPPAAGDQAAEQHAPARTRWPRKYRRAAMAVLCAAVLAAGLVSYLVVRHRQQDTTASQRPSGIPATISTSLALLMGLSPVPARASPAFTLTDQHGHTMSLASLRGHAVVLEFMDPQCTDICPIVAQEFALAYRDLGAAAARAEFIAVNVNPYHHGVSDVAAFSSEQGLAAIPSWHFLTGPVASLRAVWHAYGIEVDAPSATADVIHSSEVLFIDPQSRERYIASPMDDHTAAGKAYLPTGQLTQWGQGIALVSRQLTE